jgi:hypothetical protein
MQQISPQGLGLLGGPIDEGVDRLATDNPQRQFVLRLEPTGDLLGRPTLGEAVSDEAARRLSVSMIASRRLHDM